MIRRSQSCSWCHHMNSLDDPTQRHCANCGHRADVPRSECDCTQCTTPPARLTKEQVDQMIANLDAKARKKKS